MGRTQIMYPQRESFLLLRGFYSSLLILIAHALITLSFVNVQHATAIQFPFGQTHYVQPRGEHRATIVWLHGLTENGQRACLMLRSLRISNVKFICPTAPTRPVTGFGGGFSTAWFDIGNVLPQQCPREMGSINAAASLVADFLSKEPENVKKGVGGFSLGAATTEYIVSASALGSFANGGAYPIKFDAAVALSGFLPCSRTFKSQIQSSRDASSRAAALPFLICHGTADTIVPYTWGSTSARTIRAAGFSQLSFKSYPGLIHFFSPQEVNDIRRFLTTNLGLSGSQ